MTTIEDVETSAKTVPRSNGEEWFVAPLIPQRLYVGRDARGSIVLFLLGSRDSFGSYLNRQSLEFNPTISLAVANTTSPGAKIAFLRGEHASRAACHVAVEIADALTRTPDATNEAVLSKVAWFLDLVESQWSLLSPERAKGLAGECMLLLRLIGYANRRSIPLSRVIDVWHGETVARRDFSNQGIAVEVKTTSATTRTHRIGSMEQLLPQGSEEVFLFSIGLRLDPSGPRPISAYVIDVRNHLRTADGSPDTELQIRFDSKLAEYGYDSTLAASYDSAYRFLAPHLAPRLFAAARLSPLGPHDFANGAPPQHISSISYDLAISTQPLEQADEEATYQLLLASA